MSGTFGEAAVRLCGAAMLLLDWRPGEFWKATPAELASALQAAVAEPDAPDEGRLAALRRQFPDG